MYCAWHPTGIYFLLPCMRITSTTTHRSIIDDSNQIGLFLMRRHSECFTKYSLTLSLRTTPDFLLYFLLYLNVESSPQCASKSHSISLLQRHSWAYQTELGDERELDVVSSPGNRDCLGCTSCNYSFFQKVLSDWRKSAGQFSVYELSTYSAIGEVASEDEIRQPSLEAGTVSYTGFRN